MLISSGSLPCTPTIGTRALPNRPITLHGIVTSNLNVASEVEPYPPLPNKLVDYIFTLAASSDLKSCQRLCLVSFEIRLLVLPHLMPTVVVLKHKHWLIDPAFDSTLMLTGQWLSPTMFTKHLWINEDKEGDEMQVYDEIGEPVRQFLDFRLAFCRCPNITHLSVSGLDLSQIHKKGADRLLHHLSTLHIQGYNFPFLSNLCFYPYITTLALNMHPQDNFHLDLEYFSAVSDLTIGIIDFTTSEPLNMLFANLNQHGAQFSKTQVALRFRQGKGGVSPTEDLARCLALVEPRRIRVYNAPDDVWYIWQAEVEGQPV